jgi:FkbM family methyltransferase
VARDLHRCRPSPSCAATPATPLLVEHAAIAADEQPVRLIQCAWADLSTTLAHLPKLAAAKGLPYDGTRTTVTTVVPGARLETVLERHRIGKIDLLSVDTEGAEIAVLDSLQWKRHRVSVVIIEHRTLSRPSNAEAILEYFSGLPYDVIHRTGCNLIFAARK